MDLAKLHTFQLFLSHEMCSALLITPLRSIIGDQIKQAKG